jgi:hypothetical protein
LLLAFFNTKLPLGFDFLSFFLPPAWANTETEQNKLSKNNSISLFFLKGKKGYSLGLRRYSVLVTDLNCLVRDKTKKATQS